MKRYRLTMATVLFLIVLGAFILYEHYGKNLTADVSLNRHDESIDKANSDNKSQPIDSYRAIRMSEEILSRISYSGKLYYVEPQISVPDLLTFIDANIDPPYNNSGLLIYPALDGNKLIHIACITKEGVPNSDVAYYKFSFQDYRIEHKFDVKGCITRELAKQLVANYYYNVKIDNMSQTVSPFYKTSHYYPINDILQYLTDNDYYKLNDVERANMYLVVNHGFVDEEMAKDLFNIGGNQVVSDFGDLIGYNCFIELYDAVGSVTRDATSGRLTQPSRKYGIEEIAKPCPPRCDQFAGIKQDEL